MSSIRPAGGMTVTLPSFPDAACKGTDPSLWFAPETEGGQARQRREAETRRICSACPSRVPCLEFALRQPDLSGFWGGVTEEGRKHMRRRMLRREAGAARRAAA
ncbi:MAG TPA: WhiB family transcriptional regulator [Streptosporangiaceae bacterium]|nr:WhiB family transcriptional regulator [Streptosporangiaceae bacterium]